MHEYSLVEALVRRVEEEARRRDAIAVHGLKVSLGELAGRRPGALPHRLRDLPRGHALRRARRSRSRSSRRAGPAPAAARPSRGATSCAAPACDRPARLDERSDALLLEAIDMEVP